MCLQLSQGFLKLCFVSAWRNTSPEWECKSWVGISCSHSRKMFLIFHHQHLPRVCIIHGQIHHHSSSASSLSSYFLAINSCCWWYILIPNNCGAFLIDYCKLCWILDKPKLIIYLCQSNLCCNILRSRNIPKNQKHYKNSHEMSSPWELVCEE